MSTESSAFFEKFSQIGQPPFVSYAVELWTRVRIDASVFHFLLPFLSLKGHKMKRW